MSFKYMPRVSTSFTHFLSFTLIKGRFHARSLFHNFHASANQSTKSRDQMYHHFTDCFTLISFFPPSSQQLDFLSLFYLSLDPFLFSCPLSPSVTSPYSFLSLLFRFFLSFMQNESEGDKRKKEGRKSFLTRLSL